MGVIWWLIMSSCEKFQKDSFIRSIVSSKNVKRTFLSAEPFPDDFSKILFHGDMVNNGTYLCIEFHSRRLSSLWGVESQRNHRSRRIKASLNDLITISTRIDLNIFRCYICVIFIIFVVLKLWYFYFASTFFFHYH